MARILVVDDEQRMCDVVARSLGRHGHEVRTALNGEAALRLLSDGSADIVFTDHRMEPIDGMELLQRIKADDPSTIVVMMTAYGEVENAVAAMKAGASHYLNKPVDLDELNLLAERLVKQAKMTTAQARTKALHVRTSEAWELVGESESMQRVKELILRVAPTDATVLIRGESGTGKELCAKAIHRHSARTDGPFVAVNCAAIPESLLESELFGYMKGAFTGADKDKQGFFELADGGTIFLDELGEANPNVQSKLLRALEERKFIPVGGRSEVEVDVRIVAATNKDLEKLIDEGAFREDLYYRFNVFPVDLPPLRDRLDDIEAIAQKLVLGLGRRDEKLPADVLRALRSHSWPGNVRELRNTLERAHILAGGDPLKPDHVVVPKARGASKSSNDEPVDLNLEAHERHLIRLALRRANGNKTQAAEMLGLTRRALYSRMERLRIPIDDSGS